MRLMNSLTHAKWILLTVVSSRSCRLSERFFLFAGWVNSSAWFVQPAYVSKPIPATVLPSRGSEETRVSWMRSLHKTLQSFAGPGLSVCLAHVPALLFLCRFLQRHFSSLWRLSVRNQGAGLFGFSRGLCSDEKLRVWSLTCWCLKMVRNQNFLHGFTLRDTKHQFIHATRDNFPVIYLTVSVEFVKQTYTLY